MIIQTAMKNEELESILLSQTANYLWDYGIYLNTRQDNYFIIKLYYADEKYYEMIHSKQNEEIIIKIKEISLEDLITSYEQGKSSEEIKTHH